MPSFERDQILELFAYHHWATDQVFGALSALSAAQLNEEWGGSFGTGRALLRHVVGVEQLWFERWRGKSPKGLPDFPPTLAGRDFADAWSKVKAEQQEFLEELSRSQLEGTLSYVNIKGEKWTYPLSDVLAHVVNHGTYHRGQLTHLLRDRGLAGISTDYLLFADERRKGTV